MADALHGLDGALKIDVSGLSQRFPRTISTLQNALAPDALRYIEEIEEAYREASEFLTNSELVKQVRAGADLEHTALALIDDLLKLFQTHLATFGSSVIDPQTIAQIEAVFAAINDLASRQTVTAEELLAFLSKNLIGISSDLLDDANAHVRDALALLDPFSAASLEAGIGAARDAIAAAFRDLATALRSFEPADAASYASLEALIKAVGDTLDPAFAALETLYAALTAVVASSAWETLFDGYVTVLDAVHLDAVPTLDDAVEEIAGTVESLLVGLGMALSPEDVAKRVSGLSASLHDMFAQSALGQVRQILTGFIAKIAGAIESIPTEKVREVVEGLLKRVQQELHDLGIDQVSATIKSGFQSAHDFIDETIGDDLLAGVNAAFDGALQQLQNVPIAEIGETLAGAVQQAGQVVQDLEVQLSSALDEVRTLLAGLDNIDFKPVADEVLDEIAAIKKKLDAINPDALSNPERIAIQAAVSLLRDLDVEGMVETQLKNGYGALNDQLVAAVQAVLDAWLEFRRRVGTFDGAALAAPVTGLLDQIGDAAKGLNGSLVVAPLQSLADGLTDRLKALSPGAILDPLQKPYDAMMHTIERASPDVWVQPLRALYVEIDRLIALIDMRPLLTTLEQKEKDLFASVRKSLLDALSAVHLPAPLDGFFDQMKELVMVLTDAVFGDPDGALQAVNLKIATSLRPSMLFQPLDLAFDKITALLDTVPGDRVVTALEGIRVGVGAVMPRLDPDNILGAMRAGQAQVAALSPAALPGVVALPGLRVGLAAQLSLTTGNKAAKASLLARFDAVLAPIDISLAGLRLRRLTAAHEALVTAMRKRINGLDSARARTAFVRLDTGLSRLLPDFLRQAAPLDAAGVRSGLATLRPSTKARRIDQAVDRFMAALVPLQSALNSSMTGFFQEIRYAAGLIQPTGLKDSLTPVYTALHDKLHVLDPDKLAAQLKTDLWEPLLDPLKAIDPSVLKAELDALYQDLLGKLTGLVNGLISSIRVAADTFIRQVREALTQVLDALKAQIEQILAGITALVDKLDKLVVDDLLKRLLTLLANLRTSFDTELDRVVKAFDAMLDALPMNGKVAGAGAL